MEKSQSKKKEGDLKFIRKLTFRIKGKVKVGYAEVTPPIRSSRKRGQVQLWESTFTLSYICPVPGKAVGLDPIDAFVSGIRKIKRLIENHRELDYEVHWIEEDDGGGFKI